MFLDYGRNRLSQIMGGSSIGSVGQILTGTGSSTVVVSDTALTTGSTRQTATAVTFPTFKKNAFQFDWNSVEISGTAALTEFGLIESGGGLTGSIWTRDVIPALTFDGTNELRIEYNGEVF